MSSPPIPAGAKKEGKERKRRHLPCALRRHKKEKGDAIFETNPRQSVIISSVSSSRRDWSAKPWTLATLHPCIDVTLDPAGVG
jgi:hypothetical protein